MSSTDVGAPRVAPAGHAGEGSIADLRLLLAERDIELRERMEELGAAEVERRHLQADILVKDEYTVYLQARLAELEGCGADRDARLAALEGASGDLSERLAASLRLTADLQVEAALLRRDARWWDRLRRVAHRIPLYVRMIRPIGLRLFFRRGEGTRGL
ncbi:MAG: hypothetical protein QOE72_1999 [Chloroflexota bacterium]|jgi:hypothetical protein|nr:hypothetical protein [Chloroflexota bacterium]